MTKLDPDPVGDFLTHYGKKGMKWGVRNDRVASRAKGAAGKVARKTTDSNGNTVLSVGKDKSPQAVKATSVKIGSKTEVVTRQGGHHEAHPDAIKAKSAAQQKKKSGIDTLSNKELQSLVQRMNLEQQLRDLEERRPDTARVATGKTFIRKQVIGKGIKATGVNVPKPVIDMLANATKVKTGKKKKDQ